MENKNSFIHYRDEGIPPRYHPELRFQVGTFKRSNLPASLDCYNGLPRHRLLRGLTAFTEEVSLASKQASSALGAPVGTMKGFHLAFPSR